MRFLVIGGTGFIGRFLTPRLLEQGHDVLLVRRPESKSTPPEGARVISANGHALMESVTELRASKPDVVIDLILSSGAQAATLLDVFRGHTARVVAISSMDVYRACGVLHGLEEGDLEPLPLTEESPLRTKLQTYPPAQIAMLKQIFGWLDDDYDKIPVERAVLNDTDLSGTVLRLPMIYGPGDLLHRWFPMIKRMDDGRRAIVMPRSAAQWRSPRGYVENVAAAIALAATHPIAAGRIYNVAESESYSEAEWLRFVGEIAEWRGKVVPVPDEKAPAATRVPGRLEQHWVVDSSRIRRELGFAEPVGREEAIRRTLEWERGHPPAHVDPSRFDYAAEDEALTDLHL